MFASIFMLLQSSSIRVYVFVKVLEFVRACLDLGVAAAKSWCMYKSTSV